MKKGNETGRTMSEMVSVLAIMGILTVASVVSFKHITQRNTINEIIQAINLNSIQILVSLSNKKFDTPEQMNEALKHYATSSGGYNIVFKAPHDSDQAFTGKEFVAEITDKNGELIKGSMCRKILTTMVQVNGVSDIDFTVRQVETEDGTQEDVTMRLSGKAVDLNALCGKDVL